MDEQQRTEVFSGPMRTGWVRFFAVLAALGLILSMAGDALTFFVADAQRSLPYFWLLHLGMFVVLVPAIVALPRRGQNRSFRWRDATAGAPSWLRWLTVLLIVHAFINLAAFHVVCGAGGPERQSDGTYSISSHGRILRLISAAEYHRARGYEFRSFSGWWMLVYCLALTLLVAQVHRRNRAG